MRVRDLFDDALTRIRHERDDIHYIGEALPAPSQVASTLSTGTPASVGGSSVPAREDHIHALDLDDLESAIDSIVAGGSTTLVNTTYLTNNYYTQAEIDALLGSSAGGPNDFVWSYADLVVDPSSESFGDVWYPPQAGTIIEVVATATSASAAGNYTIKLYRSGVEIESLSLIAGEVAISSGTVAYAITAANYMQASVQKASAFTGDLEGLMIQVVYEY